MVDAACVPQFAAAARGAVALIIDGFFCSATLLNSCGKSQSQYVLTGFHCIRHIVESRVASGFPNGAINSFLDVTVIYNWRSHGCSKAQPPLGWRDGVQSTFGAYISAYANDTDFVLLKLARNPPAHFEVRANGWNANKQLPVKSALLHFPAGDLLKVSVPDGVPTLRRFCPSCCTDSDSPAKGEAHCWRSEEFRVVNYSVGSSAPGSSGGALLDASGAVIGAMHGGYASCAHPHDDFFSRFSEMYNNSLRYDQPLYGARLQPHIDPEPDGSYACRAANLFNESLHRRPFIHVECSSDPEIAIANAEAREVVLELHPHAWFEAILTIALSTSPSANVGLRIVIQDVHDVFESQSLHSNITVPPSSINFEASSYFCNFSRGRWYEPCEVGLRALRFGVRAKVWFDVITSDAEYTDVVPEPIYLEASQQRVGRQSPLCAVYKLDTTEVMGATNQAKIALQGSLSCASDPCSMWPDTVGDIRIHIDQPSVVSLGGKFFSNGALYDRCPIVHTQPVLTTSSKFETSTLLAPGRYVFQTQVANSSIRYSSVHSACEALSRDMHLAPPITCQVKNYDGLSILKTDHITASDIDGDGRPEVILRLIVEDKVVLRLDTCGSTVDLRLRLYGGCPYKQILEGGVAGDGRSTLIEDGDGGNQRICEGRSKIGSYGNDAFISGRLDKGEYWLLVDSDGDDAFTLFNPWHVNVQCSSSKGDDGSVVYIQGSVQFGEYLGMSLTLGACVWLLMTIWSMARRRNNPTKQTILV